MSHILSILRAPVSGGIAILVFFTAFYAPYLYNYPGYSGDSIKFQYIGKVLGICHPTGYPFYLGILHLFSWLPLQTMAFRANLCSMVFALTALGLAYGFLYRITQHAWLSIALTFFLGVSPIFWTYACAAEVYSLHLTLILLILWLAYAWDQSPTDARLAALVISITLSFLHHMLTVSLLPGLAYLAWKHRRQIEGKAVLWLGAIGSLALFGGVHLLLYWRTQQHPYFMEFAIPNAMAYLDYIRGKAYAGQLLGDETFGSMLLGCYTLGLRLVKEWGIVGFVFISLAFQWGLWKGSFPRFLAISLGLWAFLCSQYDITDIDQYHSHGTVLGILLIAFVPGIPTPDHPHRGRIRFVQGCLFLLFAFLGFRDMQSVPHELIMYGKFQPQGLRDILQQAPDGAIIAPNYYLNEQLLHYYAVEMEDWNKDILLFMTQPDEIRAYLKGEKPLMGRGKVIQPGRPVFAFSYFERFQGKGLSLRPLPILPGTAMAERLYERMQHWPQGYLVAVVSNNVNGFSLSPQAIEALELLGFSIPDDAAEKRQFTGIVRIGHGQPSGIKSVCSAKYSMTGLLQGQVFGGIRCPVKIECSSRARDGFEESFIRIGPTVYSYSCYGLSFVVIDPTTGEVVESLTVDTSVSTRVYPYYMQEIVLE